MQRIGSIWPPSFSRLLSCFTGFHPVISAPSSSPNTPQANQRRMHAHPIKLGFHENHAVIKQLLVAVLLLLSGSLRSGWPVKMAPEISGSKEFVFEFRRGFSADEP